MGLFSGRLLLYRNPHTVVGFSELFLPAGIRKRRGTEKRNTRPKDTKAVVKPPGVSDMKYESDKGDAESATDIPEHVSHRYDRTDFFRYQLYACIVGCGEGYSSTRTV